VGLGFLFILTLLGFYVGGAGAAIRLVMIPVTMLPSLIPLEAASVPVAVVPGGLSGILKSHYLAVLNPEISYFLLILIPILFVTAVAWLIDWYGLRLVSWFLSRLRKRSIPAEKF